MTPPDAAKAKGIALCDIREFRNSPESRVLLEALIYFLDLRVKDPEQWPALETILHNALHDAERADYEEVLADHRRLVRKLDVLMNGWHAARQASLCDLVASFPQWREAELAMVWEEAAQEADHIVKVADSTIEGRDGYEWIRLNAIIAEFTCYRNWCRARGKGET